MVREREQITLRPKRDREREQERRHGQGEGADHAQAQEGQGRERECELLANITEVKDESREKKEQLETTNTLTEALVKHDKARLEWVISQEKENHKKDLSNAKERKEQQRRAHMRDITSLVLLRR